MTTRIIRGARRQYPQRGRGSARAVPDREEATMRLGRLRLALIISRLIAALGVALCAAAALGAAILLWQAPHCRLAPAGAIDVPLDAALCERGGR
jgi:hypothetical protein